MNARTLAARLGAAACLLLVALAALPYLVMDGTEVGVYYGVGPVGPPFLALVATVALVALLSGAAERSDPATVAGVAVVLGVLLVLFGGLWAVPASGVVGGTTAPAAFDYHPWAVVATALVVFGSAAWFARATVWSAPRP